MKLKKLLKNSSSIKIFDGKKEAEKILSDLSKRISREKIKSGLAVILIGQNKASKLYIKLKRKAAERIGLKLFVYKFNTSVKQEKVLQKIKNLNNNSLISGIIVQMPLPRKFNPDEIIRAIKPEKDIDLLVLPLAILLALKSSRLPLKNKKIIALVNSDFFGKTLKEFLKEKKILTNYILRKKISQKDLIKRTKQADVIITVCGVPNLIKNDMIKKGTVLIDAGIAWPSGKKMVGDVNQESVKEKASFLTPVPGGLGPLTVALLLKNVYLAERRLKMKASSERGKLHKLAVKKYGKHS